MISTFCAMFVGCSDTKRAIAATASGFTTSGSSARFFATFQKVA